MTMRSMTMSSVTRRKPRAAVLAAVVLVMTADVAGAASRAAEPPVPDEFTDPTPEMLAASIHVWDPSGHVSSIESQTTEGDESVLRLDSDILFAFGSAELPDAAAARIETLVGDIPDGAAVSVTGHTDDIGSEADNLVLSQQRAAAVAAAVTAARGDLTIQVAGVGESEPVASNSQAEGREANRRVEIRYGG
jgi:OOP family OmpA-OmpF porin